MNDLQEMLAREAARLEASPELPATTARRARRARLRTGALAGLAALVLVAGGVALGVRGDGRAAPEPPAGDEEAVELAVHLHAEGTEQGVRWRLVWREFSDGFECLSLRTGGESRGCSVLLDRSDDGPVLAWVPEMRRTVVFGAVHKGVTHVTINLVPGRRYSAGIIEGPPGLPPAFIKFLPGRNITGGLVAYDDEGPVLAYGFRVRGAHTYSSFARNPATIREHLGPGGFLILDTTAEFGGEVDLWLRLPGRDYCLGVDAPQNFAEECVPQRRLDGGIEIVTVVPGGKVMLVAGLVGSEVDEVYIEVGGRRARQELVSGGFPQFRSFTAVLGRAEAELVAYAEDGDVIDRRRIAPPG